MVHASPPPDPNQPDKGGFTQAWEARKNVLISEDTLKLINERVSTGQEPAQIQSILRRLGQAINASLKEDRIWRTEESGGAIEKLPGAYTPPLHK